MDGIKSNLVEYSRVVVGATQTVTNGLRVPII